MTLGVPRQTPERFWARVLRAEGDDCWRWAGYLNPGGYGRVGFGGFVTYAHRLAWQFTYGPIPAGIQVRHECDNPSCVRPDHLLLGTPLDNGHDKATRGRAHRTTGRPPAVPDAIVREIRGLAAAGISQRSLARRFGIAQSTANQIATGRHHRVTAPLFVEDAHSKGVSRA